MRCVSSRTYSHLCEDPIVKNKDTEDFVTSTHCSRFDFLICGIFVISTKFKSIFDNFLFFFNILLFY